jgi:glucose-6-phosphate isomerase
VAGVDIRSLLAGAREFDTIWQQSNPVGNPAYLFGSVCWALQALRNKGNLVLFCYSQKLYDVVDWFRQLWAESLGKSKTLSGRDVQAGSTPIRALGTTDQHSQVQLYTEGPNDKFFVFVNCPGEHSDVEIPRLFPDAKSLSYLGGHRLSELFRAELLGTEVALREAGRPNGRLTLVRRDARTLGFLLQMLEVATVFAGFLYDVNPFDQPGVERGKVVAAALLGKVGLDDVRAELKSQGVEVDAGKGERR